ncbi:DUF2309 domain-containing protein [Oceanobacillus arenosus]|uniref:Probable inorganic carbon transporter subunit DabA n=1 Tax=Oceanobacillus arenosus TaxID=1229153 RepID=A0A3D8PZ83_9BACI|nr:putative inorganic carbon transporter subunit DabA [Oceanobacillus arenosus]RDW21500.1 DUF2309 domain-containing protein [Oceanobacillus arenosus]
MNAQVYESIKFDINKVVESASKVIAPYGPIHTFAARNPWDGLENQSFEKTARFLKDLSNINIMPSDSMIHTARNQGEINLNFLGEILGQWLHGQSLDIPQDVQERYCWSLLLQEKKPSKALNRTEWKTLSKRLSNWLPQIASNHSVRAYSQVLEKLGDSRIADELDRHMIKWCKLFLDESQAVWSMPLREEGFYQAWRKLVPKDPALNRSIRKKLKGLPKEADQALVQALEILEVPNSDIKGYLEAHLLALPGWAGMMLWHSQKAKNHKSLLMQYLAVRITMECILIKPSLPLPNEENEALLETLLVSWADWGDMPLNEWSQISFTEQKARLTLAYRFDEIVQHKIWLEAWEKTYETNLKEKVITNQEGQNNEADTIAQLAFCLDVRSEPFRNELEKAGAFETFGTAGFFGLPMETCKLGSNHSHNSLPVMNQPKLKVKETLPESELNPYLRRKQAAGLSNSTFQVMKHNLLSSLMLPEISGPWLTLQTLARSFLPRRTGYALQRLREKGLSKPETEFTLDHEHHSGDELPIGFTDEEKVYYVRTALETMGLTERFAPLVVICGHGSHSINNPYASSLDCGACGGASSGFNARVLATLCNLPMVRQNLRKDGISIPEDTVFAAAEHITSLDEIRWLYVPELSNHAKKAFDQIQTILPKVSEKANAKRIPKLPSIDSHSTPRDEAMRRSEDWSEVRPEWGLARNAAFIIGKRELTKGTNLEGRVFLQNYNWEKDSRGDILTNIIKGPATVCQWINLQYYASTVAPDYYGSGNKTTQTVTAGIGVMQGNSSDLLTGLPWQSVMWSDTEIYHEPLRLLVVIQAPKEYIKRLLDQTPEFQQKVQNGWIRLASIDPDGNWESWS